VKARVKVAKLYSRVRDTRRDWQHQQTTRLIRENQAIYLETWQSMPWRARSSRNRCTMPLGAHSAECWRRKPPGTAG